MPECVKMSKKKTLHLDQHMYQVALNLRWIRREGAEGKVGLAEQSPPAAQRGSSLPAPHH